MYEFTCKYCGKTNVARTKNKTQKVFCNSTCQKAYYRDLRQKRDADYAKFQASHCMSAPKTPEYQCRTCKYGVVLGGGFACCGYFEFTGHTRHSLHPEGLPDICQEFEPKKRKRSKQPIKVK